MDHGSGSKSGSDGGGSGSRGDNRINNLKPGDKLQVSTDGWRGASLQLTQRPPRDPHAGGLRPDAFLGVRVEPPLAVLLIAGEKPVDIAVAGAIRTIPAATEHLYLRDGFVAAIRAATTLDVDAEPIEDSRLTSAPAHKLVEGTRTHYPCPQACDWSKTGADALDGDALVFHDGHVGLQFIIEGDTLVGLHWFNRRDEPVSAGSLKGRQLTRRPLDEGTWYKGGHAVAARTHSA